MKLEGADRAKKGLWYNINKRRKAGKRPKRPGEKGYPDAKTWKSLTSEALLRETIRSTLADLVHRDETYTEEEPEFVMGDPKRAEWLKSLADEYDEEFGHEYGTTPDEREVDTATVETSGGQDRPLSSIR